MTASDDASVLADWWRDQAQDEINRTIPKAVEYGAGDLAEIGHALAEFMDWDDINEQDATELGIFFYHLGKVARWKQAIKQRQRASDDTLFDARVYLGMALRNRHVGGWPWAADTAEEKGAAG